jgi:hypothetical protein
MSAARTERTLASDAYDSPVGIGRERGQGGSTLRVTLFRAECGNERPVGDEAVGPAGAIVLVDRPAIPHVEIFYPPPVCQ